MSEELLKPKGEYKRLIVYQKAMCLYDMTCFFVEHFLPQIGDRTVDQMKQAARSGKQNIVEGNEAGTASAETHIKLINVAKASLKELQEDYEDYLRTNDLHIWTVQDKRCKVARAWCKTHSKPEDYIKVCQTYDVETVANIALVLLHQTDYMLYRLLQHLKQEFLEKGGIREQLSQARRDWRAHNGLGYLNGKDGKNGNYRNK